MKVSDVWSRVEQSGLPNQSNAKINDTLTRMAAGKFSLSEKFKMSVVGLDKGDMQALAAGAKQLVDKDFNGDAQAALGFLKSVQATGIGPLDFTQLVNTGAADRLVQLQRKDPEAFTRIIDGKYPDVAALDKAIAGPQSSTAAPVMATTARPASNFARGPS